MKQRVFVFCIGGTGLRVMKSVLMLLAAGMDAKDYIIVPVIIDPHLDLEERKNLGNFIEEYETIHNATVICDGQRLNAIKGFFGAEVCDLKQLGGQQNDNSDSIGDKRRFEEYLNLGKLASDNVNQYLVHTLFSQANLNNHLSVGYKGNPNVGTVVLGEEIEGADWFQTFRNSCQKGDRIFIISSIFGGTGASGYPLLEKKIRQSDDYPNVRNALLGAVSVLPYYALEDPSTTDSDIDSANFLTKAKSALTYYERSVKSDYLYYIGEQKFNVTYANDEKKQNDTAHFIELVAATALFDFLSKADDRPDTVQVMSRAIKEEADSLTILKLGDAYSDIVKAVADMTLLHRLIYLLPDEKEFPLKINRGLDSSFYNSDSFQKLKQFINRFMEWYKELESNRRSFAPLVIAPIDNRKAPLDGWVKDYSLDAKDESYYLLKMIQASNDDNEKGHPCRFRRFLHYAYQSINHYTKTLTKEI